MDRRRRRADDLGLRAPALGGPTQRDYRAPAGRRHGLKVAGGYALGHVVTTPHYAVSGLSRVAIATSLSPSSGKGSPPVDGKDAVSDVSSAGLDRRDGSKLQLCWQSVKFICSFCQVWTDLRSMGVLN